MQTATRIDHDYHGPTIHPQGEALARLTHQFKNVTGPEQVKKCLIAWGLADDISPRQARFWAESKPAEREVFANIAGVSLTHTHADWEAIPDTIRGRLWRAVLDATKWGERLRGRF
ncbi:MAG: hypothetical protein R3303_13985 [Marinobacter sp.]|nr:hypothetical protein [Marinobacter sp.]